MYDHVPLNTQGIKVFTEVLKNTALGHSTVTPPTRSPGTPPPTPHPTGASNPPPSTAAGVRAVGARRPAHPTRPEQEAQPESYAGSGGVQSTEPCSLRTQPN
ncbi:hypothetical protein AAFF_G00097600 [Aldrovandia affinis]|uniref:Uncharacterized protein n=1 Tax=Aldrovandia affinis TaxID=143900 RepID=A0AAD7RVF2_9TELE|nr:hypothetical protein AAFF_G00097600 [Aldrovandia affinis]